MIPGPAVLAGALGLLVGLGGAGQGAAKAVRRAWVVVISWT
ncbi:MAG TPA: hypothetical protein VF788_08460 [Pseudonocardiaceae bacterium]